MVATVQAASANASAPDACAVLDLVEKIETCRPLAPANWYRPHSVVTRAPTLPTDAMFNRAGMPSGQLQFHKSLHPARIVASGNGWGGTTAMACEVDAWCRGTNRWQITPKPPVQVIWFCPMYKQFEILREQLVSFAFGQVPKFFASGPKLGFKWPNGSQVFLGSYDTSWTHFQGIQPHLIAFDEQPPPALWREMRQRRRSRSRLTRFICKATQTEGWSWMGVEIYNAWLEHHKQLGLDEDQAMQQQLHPFFFVWPKGGIHDNPDVSDEICREKEIEAWPSKRERKVRLYGGFENWSGDCVFDEEGMDRMRLRAVALEKKHGPGKSGSLICKEAA
jgi:hypothetical protein